MGRDWRMGGEFRPERKKAVQRGKVKGESNGKCPRLSGN
jgi:hypothetical protein